MAGDEKRTAEASHHRKEEDHSAQATLLVDFQQLVSSTPGGSPPRSGSSASSPPPQQRLPWRRLALDAGSSDVTSHRLKNGQPAPLITVGSGAACGWRITAAGVAAQHLVFHWDGRTLWTAGVRAENWVTLNGDALRPQTWTGVPDQAVLVFGEAAIRIATLYDEPSPGPRDSYHPPAPERPAGRDSRPAPEQSSGVVRFPTPPEADEKSLASWTRLLLGRGQGGNRPKGNRRRTFLLAALLVAAVAAVWVGRPRPEAGAAFDQRPSVPQLDPAGEGVPAVAAIELPPLAPEAEQEADLPQRAAELLAHGQEVAALQHYRFLAENADEPAYAVVVRVLERRIRDRCRDEPQGGRCPAAPNPEEPGSPPPSEPAVSEASAPE